MTSPFAAILAGLGAGASQLGGDISTRELIEAQRKKQAETEAWQRLIQGAPLGITPMAPGVDPQQQVRALTDVATTQATGGMGGPSNLPNVFGLDLPKQQPTMPYGQPTTMSVGGTNYLMDPNRTPQAIAERRAATQNQAMLDRQTSEDRAKSSLEDQKTKAKADAHTQLNKQAYGALKQLDPTADYAKADYNDGVDYIAALKSGSESKRDQEKITAASQAPMSAYQKAMVGLGAERNRIAGLKGNQPTPDEVKAQTVEALATPAADALTAYYNRKDAGSAGDKTKRTLAAAASHIPLIGNSLEGSLDADYQNAMNNARTLGTQYLEIMPKSRFQPSTIDDIMKQISPELGDSPEKKATKAARIIVLKNAIKKRAALKGQTTGPDLTDIPEPPQ